MKKLLLIVLAFILTSNVNAQITSWQLVGNTLAGTEIFGSTSNHSVPFRTNNVERMRILNTGEVGIGTSTPSSWLMVKANTTGEVFRTEAPSGNDCYWRMQRNNSGTITDLGQLVTFSGQDNFNIIANRGHLNIRIGNAGTTFPAMRIRGGSSLQGYVGIGDYTTLTTPNALLQLYQHDMTNKRSAFLLNNVNTGSALTDGFLIDIDPSNSVANIYQQENQNMSFFTGNGAGGTTNRLHISGQTNYGYIGVGNTSPDAKLDIVANEDLSMNTAVESAIACSTASGASNFGYKTSIFNGQTSTGLDVDIDNNSSSINSVSQAVNFDIDVNGTSVSTSSGLAGAIRGDGGDAYGAKVIIDGEFWHSKGFQADLYCDNGALAVAVNGMVHSTNCVYAYGGNFGAEYGKSDSKGVQGIAVGTNYVYGGWFEGQGSSSTGDVWGLFAKANSGANNIGIYAEGNTWAAAFSGPCTNTSGTWTASDQSIKQNVQDITNAKFILSQLNPKSYTYNTADYPHLNLEQGTHYGVIAQEVQAVLPNATKEFHMQEMVDTTGQVISPEVNLLTVNYTEIIPYLISAYKEQQQQIDSLLNVLNGVPRNSNPSQDQERRGQQVELKNVASVILNQNDPNPFTESTRITYVIPQDISDAKIVFTNSTGVVINTVKIAERGLSELNVFSSELSSGIYTYTLVCDGKIIDSKRMLKN
jgi:hypothetical protein